MNIDRKKGHKAYKKAQKPHPLFNTSAAFLDITFVHKGLI
jgi:hypothetical protein